MQEKIDISAILFMDVCFIFHFPLGLGFSFPNYACVLVFIFNKDWVFLFHYELGFSFPIRICLVFSYIRDTHSMAQLSFELSIKF
jgi:hypothetical protein